MIVAGLPVGRIAMFVFLWSVFSDSVAFAGADMLSQSSLADAGSQWPSWQQWRRVLLLQDYNTRVVVFGVAVLGASAGLVGSFTLLRKRALMGDALSHASPRIRRAPALSRTSLRLDEPSAASRQAT